MKLLSIKTGLHDTNFCYFDGNDYHYWKSEREEQQKHHSYKQFSEHEDKIKSIWGISYDDVDEIAICFPPAFYGMNQGWEDTSNTFLGYGAEILSAQRTLAHSPNAYSNFFPAIEYNGFLSNTKVIRVNHHYAHALSTYMLCDKTPDVCFVIDGIGFDKTYSVYKDDKILIDANEKEVGSIGEKMAQASYDLGITGDWNDVAGKLMGLQTYGELDEHYLEYLSQFSIDQVHSIFDKEAWCNGEVINWIKTVHHRLGYVILDHFSKYANDNDLITYSGGVAQNVIWNTQLKIKFPNLIIPPHSGDEGLSIGAMEFLRQKYDLPKLTLNNFPYSQTDESTDEPSTDTIKCAAESLAEGNVVGWYQGNGEIGPRALGNRSILMDARLSDGKTKINLIKQREHYRPFGASILKEYAKDYFNLPNEDFDNPYMLYVAVVKSMNLPAITHIDSTCRIQTVQKDNSSFRQLMEEFYKITGSPILLNTSLNVGGKPIAGHIEDALELFNTSSMDMLVVGNNVYYEKEEALV